MFIDKDSIKAKYGNNSYVSLGQYLLEAQYSYNKVWADDSGRNLSGTMSGTLIGIFPKIKMVFRRLTKNELQTIVPILDSARQKVRYYDPNKQTYVEMDTYTGDYEIIDKKIIDGSKKNESFEVSFISIKKRS